MVKRPEPHDKLPVREHVVRVYLTFKRVLVLHKGTDLQSKTDLALNLNQTCPHGFTKS